MVINKNKNKDKDKDKDKDKNKNSSNSLVFGRRQKCKSNVPWAYWGHSLKTQKPNLT